MTVLLIDGVGRDPEVDVPPSLPEYRIALSVPAVCRFEDVMVLPTYHEAIFAPSGEYRYRLTANGVWSVPVWRLRSAQ